MAADVYNVAWRLVRAYGVNPLSVHQSHSGEGTS
jgi:hypothetical protein